MSKLEPKAGFREPPLSALRLGAEQNTGHHMDTAVTPYLDDGDVQLYHGDVLTVLRSLPAGVAQTCVTSPPYWGLRDYGTGAGQIGLEASPAEYVERMVAVFREVWRVLRDDGTVWLNLGDSYNAYNGGAGPSSALSQAASEQRPRLESGYGLRFKGLKPKDLVGIPWRVAFALQADGWYLRSDIIWAKPNPMPESVTDRPTKAHEYLFLLAKQPRYYWDADAIREPHARIWDASNGGNLSPDGEHKANGAYRERGGTYPEPNPAGRNRRSVWTVPTEPFPEAHFATYPQALVRPCILAGTSERGECSACGAPWVREVEVERVKHPQPPGRGKGAMEVNHVSESSVFRTGLVPRSTTTGWSASCACDAPTRPQTVLDPFIGSGTTALVARNHGRRAIGIDLSNEYLQIAAKRLQQLSLLGGVA